MNPNAERILTADIASLLARAGVDQAVLVYHDGTTFRTASYSSGGVASNEAAHTLQNVLNSYLSCYSPKKGKA